MKSLILSALSLFIFISNADAFSGVGRGIATDPYVVTSCSELAQILDDFNAFYRIQGTFTCDGHDMARFNQNQFFVIVREPVQLKDDEFFIIIMDQDTKLSAFHINPEATN